MGVYYIPVNPLLFEIYISLEVSPKLFIYLIINTAYNDFICLSSTISMHWWLRIESCVLQCEKSLITVSTRRSQSLSLTAGWCWRTATDTMGLIMWCPAEGRGWRRYWNRSLTCSPGKFSNTKVHMWESI